VWDGTTPSRPTLADVKNPDHTDYIFLVAELQTLQQAFLSLIQNIPLMPNLQGELDKAQDAIVKLQDTILALTPPQDLKNQLEKFEQALAERDTVKKLAVLHVKLEDLASQVDKHQLQVLKLQESFATQVTAFQSRVWNTNQKFEMEVKNKLAETERKLEEVSIKLSIVSLQQDLNK
jgi:hypothetical protein